MEESVGCEKKSLAIAAVPKRPQNSGTPKFIGIYCRTLAEDGEVSPKLDPSTAQPSDCKSVTKSWYQNGAKARELNFHECFPSSMELVTQNPLGGIFDKAR